LIAIFRVTPCVYSGAVFAEAHEFRGRSPVDIGSIISGDIRRVLDAIQERRADNRKPSSSKKETPPALWRQLIKVHPAAELFPMMSDDELVLLGRDIAKYGLREHLVVWTPYQSEEFTYNNSDEYLLDGRNRLEAIERVIADGKIIRSKNPEGHAGPLWI